MVQETKLDYLNEVKKYFYQGQYEKVLNLVGRAPLDLKNENVEWITSFQIGALVFIGELTEAQVNFNRMIKVKSVSSLFKTKSRFFLGIGCVRKSLFKEATQYFSSNILELKSIKKNSQSIDNIELQNILFYGYQGSAFYRFFKGKFKRASALASLSYSAAFEAQFTFGMILSLDLLGFSLCRTGSIRRGIYELERALGLAQELGNGGITATLSVAIVIFRSRFGVELAHSIDQLKKSIEELETQNTYSKGDLCLELARQLILRGQVSEAQNQLNQLGNLIYIHQNKLQLAQLNLLYAHLMLLRGEVQAAMVLMANLRVQGDFSFDPFFIKRFEFIDLSITTTISQPNAIIPLEKRGFFYSTEEIRKGEDVIGDYLDLAQTQDETFVYELNKVGLLGLIPMVLKIPIHFSGIFLGPSKSEMFIVNKGNVLFVDKGVTKPIKKLLPLLKGENYKSKEFLVNRIWGYEYNPIPHDSLLHATIGKLRQLLEANASWVEWSSDGYRLSPGVSILYSQLSQSPKVNSLIDELKIENDEKILHKKKMNDLYERNQLNVRQIKLIKFLKQDEFIGVSEYSSKFKVCKMTACRDLSYLHQKGIIVRVGRGRATVYGLKGI